MNCKSKADIDQHFLAKDAGCKSAKDYYDLVSTHLDIDKIAVPLLSINSSDDLICPVDAIPLNKIKTTRNWIQVNTGGGGHIEFFSGVKPTMVSTEPQKSQVWGSPLLL